MREKVPSLKLARFGSFEVDLIARELRKRGIKIKLQEQPFQVLAMLLERPAEIVTRELIYQNLWSSKETFVEFEHSLNASVARLRQALGDSANNPRFIETIPRRGYRFIAPVETVSAIPTTSGSTEPQIGNQPWAPKPNGKPRLSGARWTALILILSGIGVTLAWLAIPHGRTTNVVLTRITSDLGLTTHPALSRDGKLLAYASDRSQQGGLDVWVQQLSRSAVPIRLTHNAADEHQPVFSPDGSKIAYRSDQNGGGIYVIPALGGTPVLLAKHGRNPQWSPDGASIAYWAGRPLRSALAAASSGNSLFVVSAEGGSPTAVSTGLRSEGQPIWSPDGKHVIMYGGREPGPDLPLSAPGTSGDWYVVPMGGGPASCTGALATLKRQGLLTSYPLDIPRPAAWVGGSILFWARFHDTTNLWRIPIDSGDWRIHQQAERMTFGAGYEVYPSVAADGRIAFASISLHENLWMLPVDANRALVTGVPVRISTGLWSDRAPSVSVDGRWVVYDSTRTGAGKQEIWLKDFEKGREEMLASQSSGARHPEISRDGTRVAYSSDSGTYVISTEGGPAEKLCGQECGFAWDWSPKQDSVLLANRLSNSTELDIFDFRTRKIRQFFKTSTRQMFQSRFSPDQRWLSFILMDNSVAGVYIAPIRNDTLAEESAWIRIGEPGVWFDKPRWSPDGNLIYFVSERDGSLCVWAHRLDASTKRPLDKEPIGIYHSHTARLSMANVGYGALEIGVAKDKIVFNLGELTGNIWTLTN